jgi:putative ABC transport system substrate-binding protein
LKEVIPRASRVGVPWNPDVSENPALWKALEEAARKLGVTLLSAEVREPREIEGAFTRIKRERAQAVVVIPDTFALSGLRGEIPAPAAKNRIAAIYALREPVDAGGLMSYGPSLPDLYRRAATYVDKILKGAKPGDLPVEQPTKFEVVVNLKAAKAIGPTLPRSFLLRADQVIE